jgi:hypothetical protein
MSRKTFLAYFPQQDMICETDARTPVESKSVTVMYKIPHASYLLNVAFEYHPPGKKLD